VKVAVLGAGVVGVATAYYLARDGHEVVLVERRARAAEEASFGNGGLVSPSDAYAWASPDALRMAVKSLYRSDLGIKYKLRLDPRLWLWSLQFLTQCTHAAAHRNTLVKLRLIVHSKDCLNALVAETGIDYDARRDGILYYFRSREGLAAADRHMQILRDQGLTLERVERDRMLELEPVMARAPEVAGGIYSRDCQTGNSHKFRWAAVSSAARCCSWARRR
jgi:D-amino-acid dehydrogenase